MATPAASATLDALLDQIRGCLKRGGVLQHA